MYLLYLFAWKFIGILPEKAAYQLANLVADYINKRNEEIDTKDLVEKNTNEFHFTLPHTETPITFKILNNKDEKAIEAEIKGAKKINKLASPELSMRLKQMILSVNGDDSRKAVREFVDTYLLARDSRALREHIREIQPDMDLTFDFYPEDGGDTQEDVKVPIGVTFFWPDA